MGITYFGGSLPPSYTQIISDNKTDSALIVEGLCAFAGIIIRTNRKKNITLNVYDGMDGTGRNIILPDFVLHKRSTSDVWVLSYNPAIECETGIYVKLNIPEGGEVNYQVMYEQG